MKKPRKTTPAGAASAAQQNFPLGRSGFSREKTAPKIAAKAAPTEGLPLASNNPQRRNRPDHGSPQRKPFPGQKALRKGRTSLAGAFYFITLCSGFRRKIFNNPAAFGVLKQTLLGLEAEGLWTPYFLIAMPDHVHMVFQLHNRLGLSSVIRRFKGRVSRKLGNLLGRPVWQKGFYDHLIREDEGYAKVIRYSWLNPVRANLVEDPRDYPFWWSRIPLEEP